MNEHFSLRVISWGVLLSTGFASGCILAEPIGEIIDDDDASPTISTTSATSKGDDDGSDSETDGMMSTSGFVSGTETDFFPSTSYGSVGSSGGSETWGSESGFEGTDTEASVIVAIEEDFADWDGDNGGLIMIRPEEGFADNNTQGSFVGNECLYIHAPSTDNGGYGYAVEFQLPLAGEIDMSGEDFWISFDIYVAGPVAIDQHVAVFGLYDTASENVFYSQWFELSVGVWRNYSVPVRLGAITYSTFLENPADWIVDAVRLQVVQPYGVEGEPISFCVGSLVIADAPP